MQRKPKDASDSLLAQLLVAEIQDESGPSGQSIRTVGSGGLVNRPARSVRTDGGERAAQAEHHQPTTGSLFSTHEVSLSTAKLNGLNSNTDVKQREVEDAGGYGLHETDRKSGAVRPPGTVGSDDDDLIIETLLQLTTAKVSQAPQRRDKSQTSFDAAIAALPDGAKVREQVAPLSTAGTADDQPCQAASPSGRMGTIPSISLVSAEPVAKDTGAKKSLSQTACNGQPQGENDVHVLSAVLDAIADGQSSVSEDLLSDQEDYNVDGLIERAEHVAASAIRVEGKGGIRFTRIREHVGVCDELKRNKETVGLPTCVCARPAHCGEGTEESTMSPSLSSTRRVALCVGTTRGFVMLFDGRRRLIAKCNPQSSSFTVLAESQGSVVSISMSYDASTIAVGYEHGTIRLIETSSLSTLRETADEFSTPIVRLCHCQVETSRVLALGNCGGIKLLFCSRVMGMATHRVVKVATAVKEAPFCDVDFVFMKNERVHIVAAASMEALVIFAVDCGVQSVVTELCKRRQQTKVTRRHLQLRFVPVPQETQVLICFVRSTDVEVLLVASGGVVTQMQKLTGIRLERPLYAMTQMESCCLFLDEGNSLHLFDTSAGVVVESQQIYEFDPICVSIDARTSRYNGTVTCSGGSTFILGKSSAFTCALVSWRERLDDLVSKNRFLEALEHLKDFDFGVALAASGLESDPVARRRSIHSYLSKFSDVFLAYVLKTASSTVSAVRDISHFIKTCADVDAMHIFFDTSVAYLRRDRGSDVLALYGLEQCINSGVVTSLPEEYIEPLFTVLANTTSDASVETLRSLDKQKEEEPLRSVLRAERVLMKLEESHECLLPLSEKYNLVRLKAFILCRWQNGYTDALQHALREWRRAVKSGESSDEVAVDIFECTMRGVAIMDGVSIPEQRLREAKGQMWRHLLATPDDFETLLRVNAERVVRVTLPILQEGGPYSPWSTPEEQDHCAAQLLLHLAGIDFVSNRPFRPWELAQREWPPYPVVQQLFTGIVQLVLGGVVVLAPAQLFFDHVCAYLIYQFQTAKDEVQRRTIQADVIALLTSSHMKGVNFAFVEAALHQQRMGRALAELHYSRGRYTEAIGCYLSEEYNRVDAALSKDVFNFIRRVSREEEKGAKKLNSLLRTAVIHHIAALVEADATALAQFVFEYLRDDHEDVMSVIQKSSKTFLRYIDELVAKAEPRILRDKRLQNAYIGLLCSEDPERVYPYMRAYEAVLDYDSDIVLCSMKKHKVVDAAVYLLEKMAQVDDAVEVLMAAIKDKLLEMQLQLGHKARSDVGEHENYAPSRQRITEEPQLRTCEQALQHVVDQAIGMCAKYYTVDETRSYRVWAALFKHFAYPHKSLRDSLVSEGEKQSSHPNWRNACERDGGFAETMSSGERGCPSKAPGYEDSSAVDGQLAALLVDHASHVLMCMIKTLNLRRAITHVVECHGGKEFESLWLIIRRTVCSLRFEHEVQKNCSSSLQDDVIHLSREHYHRLNMGVMPVADRCYVCSGELNTIRGRRTEAPVRIYACGHAYHEACVAGGGGCAQCSRLVTGAVDSSVPDGPKVRTGGNSPGSVGDNHCRDEELEDESGAELGERGHALMIVRRWRHTRTKMRWPRECSSKIQQLFREKEHAPRATSCASRVENDVRGPTVAGGSNAAARLEEGLDQAPPEDGVLPWALTDDEVLGLFDT